MTDKSKLKKLLDEGMDILDALKKEGLDGHIDDVQADIADIEDFINSSDAIVSIEMSFDHMVAYLTIEPHKKKGKPANEDQVMELLKDQGITYGVDTKKIAESIERAVKGNKVSNVIVAQGKNYKAKIPDKYIYLFEQKMKHGEIKEDGRIDYKEMNQIPSVEKGEDIISFKEGVPGENGIDITGKVIEPPEIKSINIKPGTNVILDEERKVFVAQKPGKVKIDSNNVVSVVMELIVDGNYDMRYGNLDYDGILIVNGNIEEGYDIKVKGDILVKGSVYASNVFSESDIIVEKGIITKKTHTVSCEGDLMCRFIENSDVLAKGDIRVNGVILQSRVVSLGSVKVEGEKGQILNSEVFAWDTLECEKAGSDMGLKTILGSGINMPVQTEIYDINDKINRLRKAYSMTTDYMKKVIETIEDKKNIPDEVKKILNILSTKSKTILSDVEKLKEDILEREGKVYNISGFPSVKVNKEVYEGVSIQLGKAFIVNNSRVYGQKYIWDKASNRVILAAQ